MNDTITLLSNAAWSKMEALSRMRKFIQNELDHSHSLPPGISPDLFKKALDRIDGFTAEFSRFMSMKNSRQYHSDYLEEQFDELSSRYAELMQELESTVWH